MKQRRTPAERAQVQILAAQGLAHQDIARATGIPRRTVSHILAQPADAAVVRVLTDREVTDKVRELEQSFLERMEKLADDPKTPARDLIRGYEVLAEQRALRTGTATQNLAVQYGESGSEAVGPFASQLADSLHALQVLARSGDPEAVQMVAQWLLDFGDLEGALHDEAMRRLSEEAEDAADGRRLERTQTG